MKLASSRLLAKIPDLADSELAEPDLAEPGPADLVAVGLVAAGQGQAKRFRW